MNVDSITIPARDSFPLAGTLFSPTHLAKPKSLIIVSAATGVQRYFYKRFAQFLADAGHQVITFDYRGIGESRNLPLRDVEAKLTDWGKLDLEGVIEWGLARSNELPRFVVGHSVGGQVFGLTDLKKHVTGLITVASQSGDYRLWPGVGKYYLAFLYRVAMPTLTPMFGYFPSRAFGIGENLPAGVALEWAEWGRTKGYLLGVLGPSAEQAFLQYHGQILAYSFADDLMAPKNTVAELMNFYGNARRDHRHVNPAEAKTRSIGHFGFFREPARQVLWPQTLDWISSRLSHP